MDVSFAGRQLQPNLRFPRPIVCAAAAGTLLAVLGCASPGPPRAPSLGLPEPVRDLSVTRVGNTVELHFTAPSRTTDKLPLRGDTVTGEICRQIEQQRCIAVPASRTTVPLPGPNDHDGHLIAWTDTLPPDLAAGDPRLLAYRVEFFSRANRSAGLSAPAFTAAGAPPAPVDGLSANGSRLGIVLSWSATSSAGDVVLRREDLAPAPPKASTKPSKYGKKEAPAIQWLATGALNGGAARTLDTTAIPGTPYRYVAERRIRLRLDDHAIELRSLASAPVTVTLEEIYPPPTPSGVTAAGYFANGAGSPFAVDLIWQPADDAGLIAPLAGYNVYRERVDGARSAARERLNPAPLRTPAFHDTTANPSVRYRYGITAVDTKGNESSAATTILEPATTS